VVGILACHLFNRGGTEVKIVALVENTVKDTGLQSKHGLSVYIETGKHKVLFDLGPDDTYLHNAKKLSIDLAEIDTVVISHGHKDHGGALDSFLRVNRKAKIYLRQQAFEPHYIKVLFAKIPIGLNEKLAGNDRFIFTDHTMRINDELFLFSDVNGTFDTTSNRKLLRKTSSGYVQDDFSHEQSLIVTEGDKAVLLSGCSHRGIANILHAAQRHQPNIQMVFGGFHLYNPVSNIAEPNEVVQALVKALSEWDVVYHTGHCTGNQAFRIMCDGMGDKMRYFYTGATVEL